MLTVGSLFAGIGGFDLGFERAGMRTLWQVEQSEFCRRVLAKHFPEAHRFNDVRDVTGSPQRWAELGGTLLEYVDIVAGGVPCQPVSAAGLGLGEDDERWLWPDTLRLIGELRPRYAVLENPAIFLGRGAGGVLGQLSEMGYDAEWAVVSAADVGAPHLRERVWIVAYPHEVGRDGRPRIFGPGWWDEPEDCGPDEPKRALQDADGGALQPWRVGGRIAQAGGRQWWAAEPPVGRVAHGVPDRLAQLAALGNSLVPEIPRRIGRRIIEWEVDLAA